MVLPMTRAITPDRLPKRTAPRGLPIVPVLCLLALLGCSPGPDLPFPPGPAGDYPRLLPLDDILADADTPAG